MNDRFCIEKPVMASLLAFCVISIIFLAVGLKVADLRLIDVFKIELIGLLLYSLYYSWNKSKIKPMLSFLLLIFPAIILWYVAFTYGSELKTMDEAYIPISISATFHSALICIWPCRPRG